MNELMTLNNETLTMSSREIAELCEKRHTHVLADIDKMLYELEIHSADFSAQYKDSTGRALRCYNLPKDLTITLIAGYNVKLRKRIIDRWQELENQQKQPPRIISRKELALMVIEQEEKIEQLEHEKQEMLPTVKAYDRIATQSEGSMCVTDSAKHLGLKPKQLFDFLSANKWIYKRAGNANWIAYQDKLQQLLLEHKIHVAEREDGTEKVCERMLITSKGLVKLAKMLEVKQAA